MTTAIFALWTTIGLAQSVSIETDLYVDRIVMIAEIEHIDGLAVEYPEPSYEMLLDGECHCDEEFAVVNNPYRDEYFLVMTPPELTAAYLRIEVTDTVSPEVVYNQWTLEAHSMPTDWLVVARVPVNQVLPVLYYDMGIEDPVRYVRTQRNAGVSLLDFISLQIAPAYLRGMGLQFEIVPSDEIPGSELMAEIDDLSKG